MFRTCVKKFSLYLCTSNDSVCSLAVRAEFQMSVSELKTDIREYASKTADAIVTSTQDSSVLLIVLYLRILPSQKGSQILHLPLQDSTHCQQGAHQMPAHLIHKQKHTVYLIQRFVRPLDHQHDTNLLHAFCPLVVSFYFFVASKKHFYYNSKNVHLQVVFLMKTI